MWKLLRIIALGVVGLSCCGYIIASIYINRWQEHHWYETKEEVMLYWKKVDDKDTSPKEDDFPPRECNGYKAVKGRFIATKHHWSKPCKESGIDWIGLPKAYSQGWELKESKFIRDED